ncbi:MAG TPA: DUF4197 domain-containing protein [Methylomirabilota bacterium]|jgi:hypothetical protein|nr:DUF4197 domain-containing protein [Methylomirabilota bacterium]
MLVLSLLAASPAAAQLDQLLKQFPQIPGVQTGPDSSTSGALGEVKIGEALKQALQVGTANAVKITGQTDGFFKNEAIKILLPEKLTALERGLRAVGYGPQVDELVLGMNRAAEHAAPQAKQIFWDAIGALTIDDARRILDGGDTAATQYFKSKTTEPLTAAFRPIVESSMSQVGVTRQYRELLSRARGIPFLNTESYDLDQYVVGKALDGLFHVVADEEKKIRTNPTARVTDLLREVFGRR